MSSVTLGDVALRDYTLASLPRLAALREQHFSRRAEICIERARHVTRYLRDLDDPLDGPEVRQARKVAHFLQHKLPVFHDANPLAGSTTSKALGAPLFPEFLGLTLWPELDSVSGRTHNPQGLSAEEARELNEEIFPFWMDRSVLEVARRRFGTTTGMRLLERLDYFIAGKAGCISHTVPSYAAVLDRGLLAVLATVAEREQARADDDGAVDFYRAVRIALEGLLDHARHLADACERRSREAPEAAERARFAEMAAVCRRVPALPPRTFREAVNAVWLSEVGIHGENINMAVSPGRLDQVLYPFYRRDVDAGILDVGGAIELVGALWLKLADNVDVVPEASEQLFGGAGSVPAVTLGGVDAEGHDAVNDLTYVMLRATELLKIRDPNVNARHHVAVNPRAWLDRVADVVRTTRCVPAMYNDQVNIAALEGQGESTADARDYAVIGCVELSSAGREYAASSSILLNLAAPLELALHQGRRPRTPDEQIGPVTADPRAMTSYADFEEAFFVQLDWLIEQAVDLNEKLGAVHQEVMPSPLLSAFLEGPLEKGLDAVQGGARYNSSGATHIGFADVVDSLSAIEELVFRQGRVDFDQLLAALADDFAGPEGEQLRLRLATHAPHHGTAAGVPAAKRLVEHLFRIYQAHRNYRGGPYRPAYWTMTNHAGLGSITGALPSGRKAHEPFASGITPVSGAAPDLVECLHAVAALGGPAVPGGWALNLKYSPEPDGAAMARRIGDLAEAYFREGGHQVQYNLMSRAMLRDARAHRDRYPELMVRVSGYSAYFKDLNDVMQEELIARAEYDLETGSAVPLSP